MSLKRYTGALQFTAVWLFVVITLALLTGCTNAQQNLVPGPQPGDCYMADRTINAAPLIGASAVLDGKLITAGCVQVLEAFIKAKQAGVELP